MPRNNTTNPNIVLSDSEYDELASGDEDDDLDVKPDLGPFGNSITKPRHVTTSCKSLHDLIHNGTVELCPSYQRDVVWSQPKMIGLIQSLYLNFYIPPIVFAVEHDKETGEERRICIDGKQRCSSIMDFMSGKIPFVSQTTKEKFWYTKSAKMGARGKLCPLAMKNKFDMIQIQAVEYENISDAVQRDIFQRVQMGAPLMSAEKLQAIPGDLTTWINELLKKYVLEEDTLTEHMDWDTFRGKPFQNVASMAYMCWYTESRKAVTVTDLRKWLEKSDGLDEGFKKKIEVVLSLMITISMNYKSAAFEVPGTTKAPRMAPVEFWFMGYLIYLRMGASPTVALARQFGLLRKDTRSKFRDIFSNTPTVGHMYRWMDKLAVEKPGPNQQVAAVEWANDGRPASAGLAKKRKMDQRQDDEDPDYRGSSSSKAGARSGSTARPKKAAAPAVPRPAAPPPPPAARPALSAMDAAPGPYAQPSQHVGVNQYAVNNPYDQRAQQRSSNSVYGQAQPQPPYSNGAGSQQQPQARSTQPTWAQHTQQPYQQRR